MKISQDIARSMVRSAKAPETLLKALEAYGTGFYSFQNFRIMEKMTADDARKYAEYVEKEGLNLDKFNELLTSDIDPADFYETLLGHYFALSDLFAYREKIEGEVGVPLPECGMLYDLRLIMNAVQYCYKFPKH
ncbi:MAG: hypothetical protein LBH22_01610 [Bacteroidales bacterium]|jgi:hypothetical protein|nr:hypothetical protein [Bacteroidales bacterium]